ncbi:hypothetical protein [Labrenzia sp. DG1229]|uniref:hypothetical protein n=1 Tax=Labrenzia sp. DG1229 TaxID=681847 RepID=UPI00048E6966|nr:hypothetical protein [Labrenzia sp. DG1229]
MTTQGIETLSDVAWTEVANGSTNVTIATRSTERFFVVLSATAPAVGLDRDGTFEGVAGRPVGYSDLTPTDRVWAISNKGALKVSVVRS